MAVQDGNEDEDEQRISEDVVMADRRLAPCRVYRCNDSRGEHSEHDLEKGEKYFFLLVTPADPRSFVGVSDVSIVTGTIPRLPSPPTGAAAALSAGFSVGVPGVPSTPPRRPPSPTSAPASPSAGSSVDMSSVTSTPPRRPPSTPGAAASPSAGSSVDMSSVTSPPSRSPTPVTGAAATAPAGSFSKYPTFLPHHLLKLLSRMLTSHLVALGPPLHSLDVLSVDRWHEGRNSENVRAVIGILAEERLLPEETRSKRPRLD